MRINRGANLAGIWLGALGLAAVIQSVPAPVQAQDYQAIVAAPDRSDADRATDKRRDPVKLLVFTGVRPGMTVLDMGTGAGYSTELMARAVGAGGHVYGQDSESSEKFDARMKTPAMRNVTRLVRPFDDPAPAEVRDLDLITFLFFYHDTTYMKVDRAAMNKRLLDALKPGGVLIIADHSARAGEGISVGSTLHRIEESVVRREVEAAGFRFVADDNYLRHPEDPRDVNVFRATAPVDDFVLKFEKPR
jgi:predicted methyltransferase